MQDALFHASPMFSPGVESELALAMTIIGSDGLPMECLHETMRSGVQSWANGHRLMVLDKDKLPIQPTYLCLCIPQISSRLGSLILDGSNSGWDRRPATSIGLVDGA
jgi:hypothetical protein